MASVNLELVRSICADWERGDYSRTDWQHPEIEFVFADGPMPGTWTGAAGITDAWGEFLSAWENWRVTIEEYRELDEERVLTFFRPTGRGKASGVELSQVPFRAATVFHLRDGEVTKIVIFFDPEEGLAALEAD